MFAPPVAESAGGALHESCGVRSPDYAPEAPHGLLTGKRHGAADLSSLATRTGHRPCSPELMIAGTATVGLLPLLVLRASLVGVAGACLLSI
jgi:hypothetical protein